MLDLTRSEILDRFKASIAEGNIILGVGAGTGITAKSSEAGGADLFVIYNSGRFRMAGRGSLAGLMPYGDANQIVVDMGAEVLPVVKDTPVLAGVCGTDPFRVMDKFLQSLKDQGFNGVQNFPTVGLIDGVFRKNLEETGMGYQLEVDMIRKAHELDMLTCPYVFDEEQAAAMTEAGADLIVAHMGLTTGGTIGAETAKTLDDCVEIITGIVKVVKEINPDALVICHGGPISQPADAAYIIENVPGIDGFFGATSIERLAAEKGIREQTEAFKAIKK
ncbi:MAG: phosphoenolpyruvate hydrolase family protein [Anaerotardibacter sp.]